MTDAARVLLRWQPTEEERLIAVLEDADWRILELDRVVRSEVQSDFPILVRLKAYNAYCGFRFFDTIYFEQRFFLGIREFDEDKRAFVSTPEIGKYLLLVHLQVFTMSKLFGFYISRMAVLPIVLVVSCEL